jgi:hypothetical protein
MRHVALLPLCCALLILEACGSSHTSEDAAIIIDFDGAMIDGGPTDAGPGGRVGAPCGSDEDCTGDVDLCLSDPSFLPGGYCSRACAGGGDCPEGSTCVQVGMGQAFCFASCDPDATERQCREGYGCASGFGVPPVCIGGCTTDDDCATGLRCDPRGGPLGAGSCYRPDAELGDECRNSESCPMGAFCLAESFSGWPRGACIGFGCDVATNRGCPGDAQCVPGGRGSDGLCIDGCASDDDCRVGYQCRAPSAYPDRRICQPGCTSNAHCTGGRVCNPALGTCHEPFDPAQLGRSCSRRTGGCTGGTCLSEFEYGYPRAYCAYVGCTLGMDSTCPTGGVCAPGAGGDNLCLAGCRADSECRDGYRCRPVLPEDPSSSTACVPACTSNMQCANEGFVCNPGTGLCTEPFVAGNLGEPCAGRAECFGGVCLTEAEGWPAGTCAYPGCRLSGEGPSATCPPGGVCVDDRRGDPALGHCLDACTVGASGGCRPGYACVAIVEGGTEGACRPAMTMPSP